MAPNPRLEAESEESRPLASYEEGEELPDDDSVSSLSRDWSSFEEDGHQLQPLDQSANQPGTQPPTQGTLTRLNGIALVISLQIGSGIFATPAQVSQFVPSPGAGLAVWFLGGLMVWTGAASFIELGLRVPSNGGIQEYLRAAYGDVAGFLFTWVWVAIAKPATNSIIATIFAGYISRAFGGDWPTWALKLMSLICVGIITGINCMGATAGATAANVFLVLKLGALGSIIVVGLLTLLWGNGEGAPASDGGWFGSVPIEGSVEQDGMAGIWTAVGNFATAVFGATYCYGGWETIGFVLGDMKNPARDLPVVMNFSMVTVIIGFVLFNAALYVVIPIDVIRTSAAPAAEFARRTFGGWGGILLSVIISISAMGALNSNIFATAKICVKASHRAYFPKIIANFHCATPRDEVDYINETLWMLPKTLRWPFIRASEATRKLRWHKSVPLFAHLLNGVLSALYALVGNFNGLITFIGMAEYSCFLLSVIGVFILRAREARKSTGPSLVPRTWTGNPIIFSTLSSLLILRVLMTEPLQALAICGVQTVGLGVFYSRFGFGGTPTTV
ncbi:large neutral amino acids transporter small subunit 1 [Zalerion maritima]|uniref:Large neutral amino acids transporter small subunit 1 n=1 Tax=Zalerion maritima TaxID=339359 RepID=A0AAD5RLB5_9PEZI|nr:large neutral amino acids transporter small subunit 1 [Zalerion maritima]